MFTIVVRLSDNQVVDVSNGGSIDRDINNFDNLHLETNPIPAGENVKKYYRDAQGTIVKKPLPELLTQFPDEALTAVKGKWGTLKSSVPDTAPWKQPLVELAKILGWE